MNGRTFLNRSRTAVGSNAAYLTKTGIEVDASQAYEVNRRRVFFDDVSLVTLHHERGWAFIGVTGAFGAFFLSVAIFLVSVNFKFWPGAVPFFVVGAPLFIAALIRLAMGRSVVTVFGRRTRAVLRFGVFRTARAREVYGQLCAAIRRGQTVTSTVRESPAPQLPPDVPLPPLEQ
ncbi:MAG TPA: hypothetical protein VNI54_16195 [Thermoanaerobaculia bacterium]|nr:hypothetical protein [Thermoanaerobaculia bacterium]